MAQARSRGSKSAAGAPHVSGRNHLLELLPEADRARLMQKMEHVSAVHRTYVFKRHEPISHVHFPLSSVVSIVSVMSDGTMIEVGTIGNEGYAGLPLLFGNTEDSNDGFYQVPGESLRMPSAKFADELARSAPLRRVVQRYAQAFYAQIAQTTACNQVHPVERRLARWILMSHDRVAQKTILLTQEFLAQMLGVRRPAVSIVAGTLQKAGLIRYRRGVIEVLDRKALEKASCECYAAVRDEFERLLC